MSATKVTLRKRELPSGKITLYLDFYPPVRNPRTGELSRREYLGIYLFKKPKDAPGRQTIIDLHVRGIIDYVQFTSR